MDVTFKNLEGNEEENFQEDEETSPVSHKTKSYGISIDSGLIPSVPVEEQAAVLRNLGVNVFNQDEFEEGVLKQVDEAIAVKETEEIVKGWDLEVKTHLSLAKLQMKTFLRARTVDVKPTNSN